MRKSVERIAAVIGATAIAVIAIDAVSVAATGNGLVLGHVNTAGKTTTIKNTGSGAALNLQTKKSASAPFTTNAKGQVKNLNASKVGGYTAAQLRGHWASISASGAVLRSSGGISVTNPQTGVYCVKVAGVNASASVATVQPNFATDITTNLGSEARFAISEPRTPNFYCAGTAFEIDTLVVLVNNPTNSALLTNQPFIFTTPS